MSVVKTVHGGLTLNGNVEFDGTNVDAIDAVVTWRLPENAKIIGPTAFVTRSQITEEPLSPHGVDMFSTRVHNDFSSLLPSSADGTSLGITTLDARLVGSTANNNQKLEYAAFLYPLPVQYIADADVRVRVRAKTSALSNTANTVDVEVFKQNGNGAIGADLCSTSAQTLTTSEVNYDFTVTDTGFAAGDMLQVRVTSNNNDTGGATNSFHTIESIWMLLDIQG